MSSEIENVRVLLVDDEEQIVRQLSKNYVCIYGDPSDDETLKNANVDRAQFLIANMPGHGYVAAALFDKDKNEIEYDAPGYGTF